MTWRSLGESNPCFSLERALFALRPALAMASGGHHGVGKGWWALAGAPSSVAVGRFIILGFSCQINKISMKSMKSGREGGIRTLVPGARRVHKCSLQYDQVLFILEPTGIARSLARKRVTVIDYPDGRLAIR